MPTNNNVDRYEKQTNAQNIADLNRGGPFGTDSPFVSVSHRLRVSLPERLLSTRFAYDIKEELFGVVENVNGSITYLPNKDAARINVGTSAGDIFVFSSNEYFHYQSYREAHDATAFIFPDPVAGQRARLGMFETENGAYLEQNQNGDHFVVLRDNSSGTVNETRVPQSEWNRDRLDGSGPAGGDWAGNPSGLTIDFSKIQMVSYDILWYGGGHVDVSFEIDGQIFKVHRFFASNKKDGPIFGEPTLPIRWEIENVTDIAAPSNGLQIFGASASADGPEGEIGFNYSISNGATPVSVTGLGRVLTIRPKATFKTKTNRVKIEPSRIVVFAVSRNVYFSLRRDVPITNTPTWQDVNAESSVEFSVNAAGAVGGRQRIDGYVPAAGGQGGTVESLEADPRNPLVINADGSQGDVNLAVFAQSISAQATDVFASVSWKEIQ